MKNHLVATVLMLTVGFSTVSDAQRGPDQSRGAPATDAGNTVPLSDAVAMVQRQFNATAVKADTAREDGQLVYRIRLLSADKSRVWTVTVDARTGQLR